MDVSAEKRSRAAAAEEIEAEMIAANPRKERLIMQRRRTLLPAVCWLPIAWLVSCLSTPAVAQLAPPDGPSYGGSLPASKQVLPGIAWFGVLQDGLKQARQTGKPILLISAAPQCSGVPGMW